MVGRALPTVLDDLRHLRGSGEVIAESARLLPDEFAPLLTDDRTVLGLVATPECIRQVRTFRGEGVTHATSEPNRAFENLVERDILMAEHIRREADRLGLPMVAVDADSVPATAATVEQHFAPHLAGVC